MTHLHAPLSSRAFPSFSDHDSFSTSDVQLCHGSSYSYSPASSPQLTPTLATVSSFVGASFFPNFCERERSESLSSLTSEDSFDFSYRSTASSDSSLPSLASDSPPCSAPIAIPLRRVSGCRYAGAESVPMGLRGKPTRSLGGTGMIRSFSNPAATLEVSQAREMQWLAELGSAHSPTKRYTTTDDFPSSPPSHFTASSLKNSPQKISPDRVKSRPGLGRFFSFEPALLATEFARGC